MIIKEWAELLASIATVLGLPLALYSYWKVNLKEQQDRELGTYDVLDSRYSYFLSLCFENLHLGVYGAPENFDETLLSDEDKTKREILLLNLISILERAYLMHVDRSKAMDRQWRGWEQYIQDYCRSPSFVRAWLELGQQFEQNFVNYIEQKISRSP